MTDKSAILTLSQSAMALINAQRYPEALSLIDSILILEPDNIDALKGKSHVLLKLGRNTDAIAIYDKILLKNSNNSSIWNEKGVALCNLGKYGEAVVAFNTSLKINPHNSTVKTNLDFAIKNFELLNKKRLEQRGKPITHAPELFTLWGWGVRMWGDTHYFTIFWIPILPIARYSIKPHSFLEQLPFVSGEYKFYGKLELHPWQKTWQLLVIGLILGLVIASFFYR